ncbi:MAG: DUF1801 domain-containing protein [Bacteroidota bacterium]|nr:DUF1801 domain-containing protein [Bacteroidota bacterium]
MQKDQPIPATIDEYIATFPAPIQKLLQQVRHTIAAAAPGAEELISYRMPAFALQGVLVYFAAFKNHIGFYPTASGIAAFEKELAGYTKGKGSVQFPLDQPIPVALIQKIVAFKVQENLRKKKKH